MGETKLISTLFGLILFYFSKELRYMQLFCYSPAPSVVFETYCPKTSGRYLVPAAITNDWVEESNQLSILLGEGTRLSHLSQAMAGDGSHPGPLQVFSCSASSQGGWRVFGVKQRDVGGEES